MNTDEMREVIEKIRVVIPHLRHARALAAETGRPEIGILSRYDNGAGKIVASFDAGEFVEDLAKLVGAGDHTEADDLEARAKHLNDILQAAGARVVDEPL